METQDLINGAVKINDAIFQSQNKLSMVEAFQLSVRANEWGWLDLATKWIERSVNMCGDAQSHEELCQEAKTTFKLLTDVHDHVWSLRFFPFYFSHFKIHLPYLIEYGEPAKSSNELLYDYSSLKKLTSQRKQGILIKNCCDIDHT